MFIKDYFWNKCGGDEAYLEFFLKKKELLFTIFSIFGILKN